VVISPASRAMPAPFLNRVMVGLQDSFSLRE
jgi:hypothetical protein